jgi:calcineurin-like phosphoesterase family protein
LTRLLEREASISGCNGHSHGTLPDLETSRSFDVGVDCWDFYPVSYEEVAAKMASKGFEPVDGHTGIDE